MGRFAVPCALILAACLGPMTPVALASVLSLPVEPVTRSDLQRLLEDGACPGCDLSEADLSGAH